MPVKVLPQTLINQIAAGEVVVRMASVVKELVDNSIDAEATRIEVLLAEDCRAVEVRDDGIGMDRDDAELCLQRHATSKIRTAEDLNALATRGFRGEALPSIASVARVEIQTRPRSDDQGTRVVVEGGRIDRIEPFGAPTGTRILVRDLFFNTPARRKFLKSPVSELNAALLTLTRLALAQPQVGFRVHRGDRVAFDVPPGQSLDERMRDLLGSQIRHPLLPIRLEREGLRIDGFLGHPQDARGDRRSQFLFINERPFTSRSLAAAMEQACRGYVMVRRFPVAVLCIDVDPHEVDFNVHPTKEEVRFRDERLISGAVFRAVETALAGSPALVGEVDLATNGSSADTPRTPAVQAEGNPPPPPAFFTNPTELVKRAFDRKQERPARQTDWVAAAGRLAPTSSPPAPEAPRARPLATRDGDPIHAGPGERPDDRFWNRGHEPEPLGQVAETYVLARFGEDLLIIDQHAVHERLVYLSLRRRSRRTESQQLLVPITVELDPGQDAAAAALVPHLAELGIELAEFGPRTWAVRALPADLPDMDPVPLILELVADHEEMTRRDALEDLRDRIMIRTACHGSIRAGRHLAQEEMLALLREIQRERLSFTCPHGRPTIVRLSKAELDRQFKRIV